MKNYLRLYFNCKASKNAIEKKTSKMLKKGQIYVVNFEFRRVIFKQISAAIRDMLGP